MAVFWFGWAKKLKNVFTKKEADGLYLPKKFESDINEVKRLTTLKSYDTVNNYTSSTSFDLTTLNRDDGCDFTRPIYIEFEHYNNPYATKYNFVVILSAGDDYTYLTEYVSVKLQDINMNRIYFRFSNLPSNMRIRKFKIRWTPKKLL